MPYRTMDRPPLKPEAKLPVFSMHNGTDVTFSVPCFYIEVEPPEHWHDYHLHDHIGWPSHDHPDHVCQRLPGNIGHVPPKLAPWDAPPHQWWIFEYIDMNKVFPIHWWSDDERWIEELGDEAEPFAYVTFDNADKEDYRDHGVYESHIGDITILHGTEVRKDEDWIIDMDFSVDGPAFHDKPQRLMFTLFIAFGKDGRMYHRQEVVRGWLEILPSASYDYIEEIGD